MKHKLNTNQSITHASKDTLLWSVLSENSQASISGGQINRFLAGERSEGGLPDIMVRDDDDDS